MSVSHTVVLDNRIKCQRWGSSFNENTAKHTKRRPLLNETLAVGRRAPADKKDKPNNVAYSGALAICMCKPSGHQL